MFSLVQLPLLVTGNLLRTFLVTGGLPESTDVREYTKRLLRIIDINYFQVPSVEALVLWAYDVWHVPPLLGEVFLVSKISYNSAIKILYLRLKYIILYNLI